MLSLWPERPLFKDCPGKIGDSSQHPQYSEGVVGQMQHTFTTTSDITNKMMGELYKQLAAAELKSQLYRKGYRKAKLMLPKLVPWQSLQQ